MVYLPIGKAIIPVLSEHQCNSECANIENYKCPIDCCDGCDLRDPAYQGGDDDEYCVLDCLQGVRRDGKSVIFKIVDYPA